MKKNMKFLLTGAIVLIAVLVVVIKYWDYVTNPWTRDGQVRPGGPDYAPGIRPDYQAADSG